MFRRAVRRSRRLLRQSYGLLVERRQVAETLAVVERFGDSAGQHLQQHAAERDAQHAGPAFVVGDACSAGE